ncbi:MAG: NUDIX hydrolase [Verrucomicrobia bacterium]|nr:NUDIX hydrolase [Verrucomicrobiota bacterium]
MRSLLDISRELAAMAQAGLTYSKDPFDRERFLKLRTIASELLQNPTHLDFQWPEEHGYTTPKIDVRGVLFQNDQVLLVKERSSQRWTLPGGWADVNMTLSENVEREFLEETGYHVQAHSVASIVEMEKAGYPKQLHSIYKIFLLCDLIDGTPKTNIEVSEIAFYPMNNLPPLDQNRTGMADLLRAYEQHLNPTAPTFFN